MAVHVISLYTGSTFIQKAESWFYRILKKNCCLFHYWVLTGDWNNIFACRENSIIYTLSSILCLRNEWTWESKWWFIFCIKLSSSFMEVNKIISCCVDILFQKFLNISTNFNLSCYGQEELICGSILQNTVFPLT